MLFNSKVFLLFFLSFVFLYYLCRSSLSARNALIVTGSCVFYGWWDVRFLGLLIFSGCFDFFIGCWLAGATAPRTRKTILGLSLLVNLSLLGFFKYYDFFAGSLAACLASLGFRVPVQPLGIILPVGISFYTFQSLSYVIDIYRGQAKPTRSLLNYLAYVSFFPQLVAGPIQRGHYLLPQIESSRIITRDMLAEGLWLILWGLFKKVVMADQLSGMVEMVFNHPATSGPAVLAGTLAFAFQIYGDFSGYSDVACGLAKVLGFDLKANFNLPYFATDLRDFWKRWHISLSSWLRDYLYISLGGNRRGALRTSCNIMLTMLLGGLWHGAAWNFVLWGAWQGAGLLIVHWWAGRTASPVQRGDVALGGASDPRPQSPAIRRGLPTWLAWLVTSLFVLYGWLLFRAGSFEHICSLTRALADWTAPAWLPHYLLRLVIFVVPLLLMQVWQHRSNNLLVPLSAPFWVRSSLQGLLGLCILLFWERNPQSFIYFQF